MGFLLLKKYFYYYNISYICRMKKTRIEIHLESKETKILDKVAKKEGRSRKNLCENIVQKVIDTYKEQEIINTFKN